MALKRIVVVGCGSIGRRHARLLADRGDLAVELCEPQATTLQQALGEVQPAAVHSDFQAMLATGPDMVVIATPHHLHADQSINALQAGAHVLCEKPMSDNLGDARRMLDAARQSDRVFSVGFHMHFHPGMLRLKQILDSGQIGRIAHVHCRVGTYITLRNSISRYQATLRGALLLDYAHQPDMLFWLLGQPPRRAHMTAVQSGELPFTSNPNVACITLGYDLPMLATIHLNYLQMPERNMFEIVGDRGWVIFDLKKGVIRIGDLQQDQETSEQVSAERDPIYQAEHETFLRACAGEGQVQSPAQEAIVAMQVIDAALRSWESGLFEDLQA